MLSEKIIVETTERHKKDKKTTKPQHGTMFFRHSAAALFLVAAFLLWADMLLHAGAFLHPQRTGWTAPKCAVSSSRLYISTDRNRRKPTSSANDDDSALLRQVEKSQLVILCEQYHLSSKGTKEKLLKRLRDYADEQAELERKRRRERIARVEEGGQDGKERYEIVNDSPEDDEDEGYFYFHVPTNVTASNETEAKPEVERPTYVTSNSITAPPPPPTEPDENGERVVTVYSTKDHNDLTGIAATQPGYNALSNNDAMMAGSDSASSAPWDMDRSQRQSEATSKELEEAKETVAELVHALLAMTGAPAFREEFSEGLTPMENRRNSPSANSPDGFVGFDPSKVPTDILVSSSLALRSGRGQVLQDVLRDYELRAVGHDGMAGDDEEKGGGHYREVCKVRSFLEGYRRAEVRRVARETTTVLLDKLVAEGIEGLDFLLASMTKTSDDTGDVGELNDALLDFLNDAIRQQEKKVEQLVGSRKEQLNGDVTDRNGESDPIEGLWNVTNEDGVRVETLDPNDPRVQDALKKELLKGELMEGTLGTARPTPETASEKLLLLLTLLRERIKAEAAFASDEKGRNLRILAYCLHVGTEKDREQIIKKEVGTNIDVSVLKRTLDDFLEGFHIRLRSFARITAIRFFHRARRKLNRVR